MSKRIFKLVHSQARSRAIQCVQEAPDGFTVSVAEPTRNLDQNAKLWASLHDVSQQVEWYGRKLTSEDWKHVFSSSLRKLEVVPNLDGTGFVALGQSTSRMSVREMADLITLIAAFGDERGVVWSEPLPPELRGIRKRAKAIEQGRVDAITGELLEVAA